jgi:hypothetical protein
MTFSVMHFSIFKFFLAIWGLSVSKDAEFYVDFKKYKLVLVTKYTSFFKTWHFYRKTP